MYTESVPDPARSLARFSLAFEDMAADIRRGAEAGGLTLSEVRLLDGISRGVTGARQLSRRLRLDEGHVSRMVKRLRHAGYVSATRADGDARRVVLDLTASGAARLAEAIDGAARAAAAALGDRLPGAAPTVGRALQALVEGDGGAEIALTGLQPGDAGWVIAQHGALYSRDEAFDDGFEAEVARIVSEYLKTRDPARETAWIARAGHQRIGCVFCMAAGDDSGLTAQLRLFLVRPEWRRRGLGQRLLDACRDFAVEAGYQELILYTHREHKAACKLYDAYGFVQTESRRVSAHGRRLTEQIWALPLDVALTDAATPA